MNGQMASGKKCWSKIKEQRRERKQQKMINSIVNHETLNSTEPISKNELHSTEKKSKTLSTIAIAVPGSILDNAQSPELRSYVAGQIARAACIFRVDEVIVFDDIGVSNVHDVQGVHTTGSENELSHDDGRTDIEASAKSCTNRPIRNSCLQLARILQYLECPQYLRKSFFPMHNDLKYSGLLNPLDAPHHLRQQNSFQYREGVVIEKAAKPGRSYVNVGLTHDVLIDKALQPGIRLTVKLDTNRVNQKKLRGMVVSPREPRQECGVYWGYNIRIAHSLLEVFTKSPYTGGYDVSIGTSDRGTNIYEIPSKSIEYQNLLIVFGGLKGLEEALANEEKLQINDPKLLFDHYLNTLPRQGSRTIRTEEAILITMTALQDKLNPKNPESPEILYSDDALANSTDTGLKCPKRRKKEEFLVEDTSKTSHNIEKDLNDLSRFD